MTNDPLQQTFRKATSVRGASLTAIHRISSERKPWAFAAYGVIGGLLAALVGELLFLHTVARKDVCVVIDASGSMMGDKLAEVKRAATGYADRQDMAATRLAVVGFGSSAQTGQPFTHDVGRVRAAILTLDDGGSTNMSAALSQGLGEFARKGDESAIVVGRDVARCLLLFTDGVPDDSDRAIEAARACRDASIQIVAIATGDADVAFLSRVTGDPALVFRVSTGEFHEGFRRAERVIGTLVESRGGATDGWVSIAMVAAWSALLAVGIAVALTHGQNRHLGRPMIAVIDCVWATLGGIAAGAVAGLIGQMLYAGLLQTLTSMPPSIVGPFVAGLSRTIGWTVLGALVARGLAFFIPNLRPTHAWTGGAFGGAVAALAFLAAATVGDVPGRLVGAALLGGLIGMMVALIESSSRVAWLEIDRGRERATVNLGPTPVTVGGSGRECTVFVPSVRSPAASYRFIDGRILLQDYATERESEVASNDSRRYGAVQVTVRTSAAAHGTVRGPPTAVPAPPPPPPPQRRA
jgi:Ca-activated chloride channel family protein